MSNWFIADYTAAQAGIVRMSQAFGPDVAPTLDPDSGLYRSPEPLFDLMWNYQAFTGTRFVLGDYGVRMASFLPDGRKTAIILEDPISRSLGVLRQQQAENPNYKGRRLIEMLSDRVMVQRMITNFQTRMLLLEDPVEPDAHVMKPLPENAFDIAKERLDTIECIAIEPSDENDPYGGVLVDAIRPLVELDIALVEYAKPRGTRLETMMPRLAS